MLLPPRDAAYGARVPPLPTVTGSTHLLDAMATKGNGPSLCPFNIRPRREERSHPPAYNWGAHLGTRPLEGLCRPGDHPPGLHTNKRGVSLALLDHGNHHAPCWLRAPQQLMQKPQASQVPCIRWGGPEMIYSGNLHCTTIKSLRGADGICIPLPATSRRHLS